MFRHFDAKNPLLLEQLSLNDCAGYLTSFQTKQKNMLIYFFAALWLSHQALAISMASVRRHLHPNPPKSGYRKATEGRPLHRQCNLGTAHRPRKPSSRWTKGRTCTNIQPGPLNGSQPLRATPSSEQEIAGVLTFGLEVIANRLPGMFSDLKLHRPSRFSLPDRDSVDRIPVWSNVLHLEASPRVWRRSGRVRPLSTWIASSTVYFSQSLTALREKLVKIGAKVVRHGRYVTFQWAEVAVPKSLFQKILGMIDDLRGRSAPA